MTYLYPPTKIRRLHCILLILFISLNVSAQQIGFGFKASYLTPLGALGQFYNKAPTGELYIVTATDKDIPFRLRFGLSYANLTSRLDTFPVYAVQTGVNPPPLYVPGYLIEEKLEMKYIHMDFGYRVVRVKGFSLFAAAGIEGYVTHIEYVRSYENIITENASKDIKTVGYELSSNIEYRINKHFDVLAEAAYHRLVASDWSTTFWNYTYSIGINYFINKRDE